jgi:hypothetical protein
MWTGSAVAYLQYVIGVPSQLMTVIQNMYSGDAYRLVDGRTGTAPSVLLRMLSRVAHLARSVLRCFLSNVGDYTGVRHSTGRMGVLLPV